MVSQRGKGNSNRSGSGNQAKQGQNGGNQRYRGKKSYKYNKPEFKFQLHDSQRKGQYTCAKIIEAIVIKVQKEFGGGRLVANSLRSKEKIGPTMPTLQHSAETDPDLKAKEQAGFQSQYDAEIKNYFEVKERFDNEWVRAYSLILDNYCTRDMQVAIKEEPDFESRIRDDPVELLKEVERLSHIPRKAQYPVLALVETLTGLLTLKQGEKESLTHFLERFKSERNVISALFGDRILDEHVERSNEYKTLPTGTDLAARQTAMKKKVLERFYAIMFLRQSDHKRYGALMKEFRQSYANRRDIYPENLSDMFEVMRTVSVPKGTTDDVKKEEDKIPPGAESFAQTGEGGKKNVTCFVCGKPGELASNCKMKTQLAEKDWYKSTGVKHYLTSAESTHCQICDDTVSGTRVGFVLMQTDDKEECKPDILLDCGSTISLFKDKQFLKGLRDAKRSLRMNTNAGSKWVTQEGNIPGYGPVYYDDAAISNLFSMSEIINRGYRITFDSAKENVFYVHLPLGEVIRFPVNKKGLYVKEKEAEMDKRRAQVNNSMVEEEEDEKDEKPPPLIPKDRVDDDDEDDVGAEGVRGDDDVPDLLDADGKVAKEEVEAAVMATACEGYTPRQVLKARKARKFMHDMSAPSYKDLRKVIRMNHIKNCPVSIEDIGLAERIFGKDVPVLKGKTVRPKSKEVNKKDVIDLPSELEIKEGDLSIDVVYIETEAFLNCIDRTMKAGHLVPLGTKKQGRCPAKDIKEALSKVILDYNANDVLVKTIHADGEFRPIEQEVMSEFEGVKFNFALPDEHVPDVERENRVLEERFRTSYHLLPYKCLPRQMIREGMAKIAFDRNLVVKEESCSAYFTAQQMLWRQNIDFDKEFEYSFGTYVIAYQENKILKNDTRARGRDAIYLRAERDLQGGHRVLDLLTGRVISRPTVEECRMTENVVAKVNEMAAKQGITSNKFYDRRGRLLTPVVEGVGDNQNSKNLEGVLNSDDLQQADLPPEGDVNPGVLLSDEELSDEELDAGKVADILDDAHANNDVPVVADEHGDLYYEEPGLGEENIDEADPNCDPGVDEVDEQEQEPDLVSEPEEYGRMARARNPPPRYNPETGDNYMTQSSGSKSKELKGILKIKEVPQDSKGRNSAKALSQEEEENNFVEAYCHLLKAKESRHNIRSQVVAEEKSLDYVDAEAQYLAQCFTQMLILPKAVKEFGTQGVQAAKKEVKQLHERKGFRAIAVEELTRQEKQRAMEGLMFVTEKRSGEMKGRLAYNGKPTRAWVGHEEKSSPTAATESILLTIAIDALQKRDIISIDIPNAFIQAKNPRKEVGKRVIMKVRGRLVDWLIELSPADYKDKVVYERGVKVLYLLVEKAIYGMLEASLIWYRTLRKDLEQIGFKFNTYDFCIANRYEGKDQQTLRLHVDDMLVSCRDAERNKEFHKWCQSKYGAYKEVKCNTGKKHAFLGMTLDFGRTPGAVHVSQDEHVSEMIEAFPESLRGNSPSPAGVDLFDQGAGGLLCKDQKETFHTIVAKGLFITKRSRPDIGLVVSVLSSRVRCPNKDDWRKVRRLCDYLKSTKELHLVLNISKEVPILKWSVDASFATHPDFRSHSGAVMRMGDSGGAIISGSLKQKLNTRSSTEAEIVAVDDFIAKMLWTRNFLERQHFPHGVTTLLQDNSSAIHLQAKGFEATGKRMRHLNIRYFFARDCVSRGLLRIEHQPTAEMEADYLSKPLQGKAFLKFRDSILGLGESSTTGAVRSGPEKDRE